MVAPRYDDSRWPLFCVLLPAQDLSEAEFAVLVETMDRLYLRGGRFGVLIDARNAPPLTAKRRQLLGERGKAAHARYPGMLVGLATVLSSPVQRGIHTAIHWLVGRHHQMRAFSSTSEAEAWLGSLLKAAGADAPHTSAPR